MSQALQYPVSLQLFNSIKGSAILNRRDGDKVDSESFPVPSERESSRRKIREG
jgi:hypothetical protein